MKHPPPNPDLLADLVRFALGRGLPVGEAEDVVFAAWEKANAAWQPERGALEALLWRTLRNDCSSWWRSRRRREQLHRDVLQLRAAEDRAADRRAAERQEALLESLDGPEQQVFAAWALQKHLGKGQIRSEELAAGLGLDPAAYDNAKRRLKGRLHALLDQFGWTARQVLHGDETGGQDA